MEAIEKDIRRKSRQEPAQLGLFSDEPAWTSEWWGMPEFSNDDIRPTSKITVNFLTHEDRKAFAERLGVRVSRQTDSMWFPAQEKLGPCEYVFSGPPSDSRYPVCIPSKGRALHQTTGKVLDRLGVSYRFFVEETEADQYREALGESRVVSMPFHDLGQGSIPARNFIWEWAKERGYRRHWTVDDNITAFTRVHLTRRLRVEGGRFFQAMEDFVDRYENVVMSGPHHDGFIKIGWSDIGPFALNSRIYSCILLDTSLHHRWRGRYNEDTDLSLRILKDGYCTLLFNSLCMHKHSTVGARNSDAMPGGNTDHVYNTGDHRLAFAESLREQHPDCVKVVWKFNRWHHQVDYSAFAKNKPRLRDGVTPTGTFDNYGMTLVRQP